MSSFIKVIPPPWRFLLCFYSVCIALFILVSFSPLKGMKQATLAGKTLNPWAGGGKRSEIHFYFVWLKLWCPGRMAIAFVYSRKTRVKTEFLSDFYVGSRSFFSKNSSKVELLSAKLGILKVYGSVPKVIDNKKSTQQVAGLLKKPEIALKAIVGKKRLNLEPEKKIRYFDIKLKYSRFTNKTQRFEDPF